MSRASAGTDVFHAVADPHRRHMLVVLRAGEQSVGGLVEATRDGRRMIYRLRGGHVRALLAEALFQADHQVSGEPTHD